MNPPDTQTDPMPRQRAHRNGLIVAAGAAVGLTLAGLGVAGAQTNAASDAAAALAESATSVPATGGGTAAADTPSSAADGSTTARAAAPQETPLTGETAEKVKAAALKAVPGGTVIRVETDSDGSPYEAHVRKTDGSEAVVKVNEAFEVTSIEEGHGGGPYGRGGPHGGRRGTDDDASTTPTTGASA